MPNWKQKKKKIKLHTPNQITKRVDNMSQPSIYNHKKEQRGCPLLEANKHRYTCWYIKYKDVYQWRAVHGCCECGASLKSQTFRVFS